MRRLTILLAVMLLCTLIFVPPDSVLNAAAAPTPGKGEVKMVRKVGTISRITTPASITGGKRFSFKGDGGNLEILGESIEIRVRYIAKSRTTAIAIDKNIDGKIDSREWILVQRDRTAACKLKKKDGKEFAIVLRGISVRISKGGKDIASVGGLATPAFCMEGSIDRQPVKIVDDNLDGKFTQDGNDAIIIGRSQFGIPLAKTHLIGKNHCTLQVSEDGESMQYEHMEKPDIGMIAAPILIRGIHTVVIHDEENSRAYDLVQVQAARMGIPAGTYKFLYARLGDRKITVKVSPTKNTPEYKIEGGMLNTMRLGAPLWVKFNARSQGGKISVSPSVSIFGQGNEQYNMPYGDGITTPSVAFMEGKRQIRAEAMEYG